MLSDWGLSHHDIGSYPDDPAPVDSGPKRDGVYEIVVAMAYDGKVMVVVGAEEFTSWAAEEEGSYYFRDGIQGPSGPGLYRFRVKFVLDKFFSDAECDSSPYFREIAWAELDPDQPWHEIEGR